MPRCMLQFTEKKTMQMRRLHPPTVRAGREACAGARGRAARKLLLWWMLLIGCVAVSIGQSTVAERPHIIFILADDLVSGPNKPLAALSVVCCLGMYVFHSIHRCSLGTHRALMISAFVARRRFPRPISMLWPIRVSYSIATMSIPFVHPRALL